MKATRLSSARSSPADDDGPAPGDGIARIAWAEEATAAKRKEADCEVAAAQFGSTEDSQECGRRRVKTTSSARAATVTCPLDVDRAPMLIKSPHAV